MGQVFNLPSRIRGQVALPSAKRYWIAKQILQSPHRGINLPHVSISVGRFLWRFELGPLLRRQFPSQHFSALADEAEIDTLKLCVSAHSLHDCKDLEGLKQLIRLACEELKNA